MLDLPLCINARWISCSFMWVSNWSWSGFWTFLQNYPQRTCRLLHKIEYLLWSSINKYQISKYFYFQMFPSARFHVQDDYYWHEIKNVSDKVYGLVYGKVLYMFLFLTLITLTKLMYLIWLDSLQFLYVQHLLFLSRFSVLYFSYIELHRVI